VERLPLLSRSQNFGDAFLMFVGARPKSAAKLFRNVTWLGKNNIKEVSPLFNWESVFYSAILKFPQII